MTLRKACIAYDGDHPKKTGAPWWVVFGEKDDVVLFGATNDETIDRWLDDYRKRERDQGDT